MANGISRDVKIQVIAGVITAAILSGAAWVGSSLVDALKNPAWWWVAGGIGLALVGGLVGGLFYRLGRRKSDEENRQREFQSALSAFNLVPVWGAVVRAPQFDSGWAVQMILSLQNSRRFPGLPILSIGFEARIPGTTWHHGTSLVTPLVGRDANGDAFFEFTLTTINASHVEAMQRAAQGESFRHAVLSNIVVQAGPATMRFPVRILPLHYQVDPERPLNAPQLAPDERSAIPPPVAVPATRDPGAGTEQIQSK